jgi:hypothetical protein
MLFFVVGSNGENISTNEVDAAIVYHPAVLEASIPISSLRFFSGLSLTTQLLLSNVVFPFDRIRSPRFSRGAGRSANTPGLPCKTRKLGSGYQGGRGRFW